jgi:hypothetical protein
MNARNELDTDDAPAENYPDELGLGGTDATYDPPDAPPADVTIRGTDHRGRDEWAIWIETADGVIETTDAYVEVR